jgi:hypothetical protein
MIGKGENGILPCSNWVGPPLGNMDSIGQAGSKLEGKPPWQLGKRRGANGFWP